MFVNKFFTYLMCAYLTAEKIKFSIKDFFSKCDQICSFLRIWSHLLKKSSTENFTFCTVSQKVKGILVWNLQHVIFKWRWTYWQIFKSALVYLQRIFLFFKTVFPETPYHKYGWFFVIKLSPSAQQPASKLKKM